MNVTPLPGLLRFSLGVSRVGIRHGSHFKRFKKPQIDKAGLYPGLGEQIWIFNHIMTNQIIYSHKPVLDSNRALRQLPFNGKKTKPAKLRKDYWKPMALIKFPEGAGEIGRSVFQKLREFKMSHELEWGYQAKDLYKMDREDRGRALNNQKANAIADMASVLGGAGRGNLIAAGGAAGTSVDSNRQSKPGDGEGLAPATIYWLNSFDKSHAPSWTANVSHQIGLYVEDHRPAYYPEEDVEPVAETEEARVV